jgi:hypothetical protein
MWVSTLDGISVVDMAQTAVGCRLESIIRLVMMDCFFYLFDGNHGGQLNTCQFWTVNNTSITTMSHGSFCIVIFNSIHHCQMALILHLNGCYTGAKHFGLKNLC